MSWNTGGGGYGGQSYGQNNGYSNMPSVNIPQYGAPSGPPPQQWNGGGGGGYAPPSGPPPMHPTDQYYPPPPGRPPNPGGYPGREYRDNQPVNPGGYYRPPEPQPMGPAYMPPQQTQYYGPQVNGGGQPQQPFFQYSQCNGRKKALCIGVNYTGQSAELRGCINDANAVANFLCGQFGYKRDDIVILTDNGDSPAKIPTGENIRRAMQWLVNGAQPNDSLFFHYSGHGGQTKDLDGDEDDGYDEVIYPIDYEENGHIVDDELHFTMVKPLPIGCRLTAIFDSCHSGSALDLPYMYSTEGKIKEPNLLAEAGQGILTSGMSYLRGDTMGALKGIFGTFKQATSGQGAEQYAKQTRTSSADVISWSGCKDSQTSADTQEAGTSTGAMSWAFINALSHNPQQTYMDLLKNIREELRVKYSQKPQLSASHPMDTNIYFLC